MKESERIQMAKDHENKGESDKAIEIYEKCLELKSFLPHPYNRLATLYKKSKDFENEVRVLKLLLSIQETEAKRNKWIEGTRQYDKINKTRDALNKAIKNIL